MKPYLYKDGDGYTLLHLGNLIKIFKVGGVWKSRYIGKADKWQGNRLKNVPNEVKTIFFELIRK